MGANPLASKGYTLSPLYTWGYDFFVLNYQSTTGNGPIFRQLYFRQALEYLTNQKAIIEGPMRGYGEPTVGPVGNTPLSKLLSSAPAFQLTEVANNLKGALPQSSTLSINPENWYFVK